MLTDYPDMNQSQMSCSYKDQQTKLRELLREKQDAYRKKARYQIQIQEEEKRKKCQLNLMKWDIFRYRKDQQQQEYDKLNKHQQIIKWWAAATFQR